MIIPEMPGPAVPSKAQLARHGNLVLSFWAPPADVARATAVRDALLRALATTWAPGPLWLLGVPARLPEGLQDSQPAVFELLARLLPESPQMRGWRQLSAEDVAGRFEAWRTGQLTYRETRHDAHGQSRIHSVACGRLVLPCSVAALRSALEASPCPPGVQCLMAVLDNPLAGLSHADGQRLRTRTAAQPDQLQLMWPVARGLVALGEAVALADFRDALAPAGS